jgi:peroxiredoxin
LLPLFLPPLLPVGQHAADFQLLDHHGHSIRMATRRAESNGLILLFMPSDFLKADLAMLQAFSKAYERLNAENLALFVVSGINWEKLHTLGKRLDLPFSLVFDPCCRYAKQYNAMWVSKFINGRAGFAISPEGRILWATHHPMPEAFLSIFQSQSTALAR